MVTITWDLPIVFGLKPSNEDSLPICETKTQVSLPNSVRLKAQTANILPNACMCPSACICTFHGQNNYFYALAFGQNLQTSKYKV